MSSINAHYTFNYSQPEEYRFSHDSVFMARKVFEHLANEDLTQMRGLDLCSGCGIVGLDFLFHYHHEQRKMLRSFDFLEVQEIYRPHFERNIQNLSHLNISLEFKNANYSELKTPSFENRYDLILCNPPYFQLGQGKLSPSEFKNRCRFFIDSDFQNLILGIANSLAPQGRAFLLLRSLEDHGFNYFKEAQRLLSNKALIAPLDNIRGTDLVRITRYAVPFCIAASRK